MSQRRLTRPAGGGLFVVLLPTLECNLACRYCFEDHRPGRWSLGRTAEVLDEVFQLSRALALDHLCLHWQGGEALLMGLDYWAATLELAEALGREAGVRLEQRMQTNLTLYRRELAPLAHRYLNGRLGTSFEPGHDRRFPDDDQGRRFRQRWSRALAQAEADGLEVGVLSLLDHQALSRGAPAHLEQLREQWGVRRLRLTLPFHSDSSGRGQWLDPAQTGTFLSEAYRWWRRHRQDVLIRPFPHLEQQVFGLDGDEAGLCTFASSCADGALSIGPDGTVALCDCHAAGSWLTPYGALTSQSLVECFESERRGRVLGQLDQLIGDRCLVCRWLSICHGGCLARVREPSRALEDHYCAAYQRLFEAIAAAGPPGALRSGTSPR